MNLKQLSIIFLSFFYLTSSAQLIQFGTNNYIEYHYGNLPIIISVPHDGELTPASIPDRTCNNPTIVRDIYTKDLALMIKDSLSKLTGCYPHLIICHLKRTKLDCNRDSSDATCGNNEAMIAWREFYSFIDTAQQKMLTKYGNKLLYIDLHAHGHDSQMIELGYLLTASDFNQKDSMLNLSSFISKSSIGNLALSNYSNQTHAELLRGKDAFGTYLWDQGYPSVPSKQMISPDTFPYFNGGFNTKNQSCAGGKSIVNGFQIELNNKGIRDNTTNRGKFAKNLSTVILNYLSKHFNYNSLSCKIDTFSSILEKSDQINIFPNPASSYIQVDAKYRNMNYRITNLIGRTIQIGQLKNETVLLNGLEKGLYVLEIRDRNNREVNREKFVIE